jgi:hypothetical protein
LTAKDRRARQLWKGSQLRRRQDGIEQFKERIAGAGETTIQGLAEGGQPGKLRLGSVFAFHRA